MLPVVFISVPLDVLLAEGVGENSTSPGATALQASRAIAVCLFFRAVPTLRDRVG
jgi:hypothetical protein